MAWNSNLLPLSALQHLVFCERQCALIHVEGLWAENRLTVEGNHLHRKAHDGPDGHRKSVRMARGMELVSHELGLIGRADVVEFPNEGPVRPVEYKRGRPKRHDADLVQLCAQAICLEEMLGLDDPLPEGAIFYGQTRRRLDVLFTSSLREKTRGAAARLHAMIASGVTPTARRERKCDRCSLLALCLPDAMRSRATARRYIEQETARLLAVAFPSPEGSA